MSSHMKRSLGTNKRKDPQEAMDDRMAIYIWVGVVIGVFLIVVAVLVTPRGPSRTEIESASVAEPARIKMPEGVELFVDEGQNHVAEGTRISYKTDPPTSGMHYDRWAPPSVYEAGEVQPELLVHNLEHGNVVIYFDRSEISEADASELIDLSKKHIGQWDGVLLVVRNDKEHPVILTAWRAMLRLKEYDKEKVLGFLDAFRGRGPEKPVR